MSEFDDVDKSVEEIKAPVQVLAQPIKKPVKQRKHSLCAVCLQPLDLDDISERQFSVTCTKCLCSNNIEYVHQAQEALIADEAKFHFDMFYNPVKSGIIQIGTPKRKASLLDVGGTLQVIAEDIVKVISSYTRCELMDNTEGTFDFIFLNNSLLMVNDVRGYLRQLKPHLKSNGLLQINLDYETLGFQDVRSMMSVPWLYHSLLMTGYQVKERLCISTDKGQIICCQQ